MSQSTDYVLSNQSGANFRSELNSILAAIVSQNSGSTAPTTTYAYQLWIDTSASPALLKIRNGANSGWITIGDATAANLGLAALASPTFTGTPAGPTASVDTSTTQLATTAYVVGQAASATPIVNGTAAVGTSTRFARQDHVHPIDTTRAPLASPTFTGTVTIPAGASISGFAPLASPTFTGTVTIPAGASISGFAPLASPTFTGTPTVPGYLTTATASSTYAALATAQSFTAAQRGTVSALGSVSAGTTTLDFATANNFSLTLPAGGTVSLGNPSNQTAGQSGVVTITQNGTTAALVTYGGNWKFQGGAPSVSTTLSSVNVIAYYVESASRITAQLLTNTVSS